MNNIFYLAAAGFLVTIGEITTRTGQDWGFAFLLAGLVFAFLGTDWELRLPVVSNSVWSKRLLIFGGLSLFLFSLWLRGFDLNQFPPGFYFDEAQNGLEGLKILHGESSPVYVVGRSHVPALFFWSTAASFGLFGIGPVAVRLVSAFCGSAAVPALMAVLSARLGVPAILLAGLAFAGLRWSLNFSRIGFLGMQLVLLELLVFAFLILGFRKKKIAFFVFAGLCLGLTLYSYLASPIVVAVAALLWIQAFVTAGKSEIRKRLIRGFAVFAISGAIVFAPLGYFYFQNPGHFGSRTAQVSLIRRAIETGNWDKARASIFKHLRMFHQHGDNNPRHNYPGKPIIPAAASGLAILGIGVAVRRIREPEALAPLALGLGMIQGGIWTNEWEAPQAYRTLGMMAAVPWLGALYLDQVFNQLKHWDRRWFVPALLSAFGLVVSGVAYDVKFYFEKQATHPRAVLEFESRHAEMGKSLRASDEAATVFVDARFYDHPTVVFMSGRTADQVQRFDILNYSHVPPAPGSDGPGLYYLEPHNAYLMPLFRHWYGKNYQLVRHRNARGDVTFVEINVPEESRIKISKVMPILERGRYKLRGLLPIHKGKLVQWKNNGGQDVILKVDRKQILPGRGQSVLAGGLHPVFLSWPAEFGESGPLTWTGGETAWSEFTSKSLIAGTRAYGLLGDYRAGGSYDGEVALSQLDPFIFFQWHIEPISPAYTAVWRGWLEIQGTGEYKFKLEADDEAFFFVDQSEVVRAEGKVGPSTGEGTIFLRAGFHKIEVRYKELGGLNNLTWWWKIPGADEYEIVPPNVLLPPWERPSK